MGQPARFAMDRKELNLRIPSIVDGLVANIVAEPRTSHLNQVYLPNRDLIVQCIHKLRQIAFPGYFGGQGLTRGNLSQRTGQLVTELVDLLFDQVCCCLRYRQQLPSSGIGHTREAESCDHQAAEIVANFFDRLPAVRDLLAADVQAAFDSDPAAQTTDETIFCYPGVYAITVQRLAHEFLKLAVPLLPRIMTEHAHGETGIDIHPGASLGRSFFIDHGTGVVKIYQGVTLGALAPAFGQLLRGRKRHPTIEDDVIIYAGATILGGDTVIGKGAVINGNVFVTTSVPAHTSVSMEPPKLTYRQRRNRDTPKPDPANPG
jgi:serine O-acetyltransferase